MKRRQQDAQAKAAKHCTTENRQQEAQAIAAIKALIRVAPVYQECSSIRYCCSCVSMFKYLMYTL